MDEWTNILSKSFRTLKVPKPASHPSNATVSLYPESQKYLIFLKLSIQEGAGTPQSQHDGWWLVELTAKEILMLVFSIYCMAGVIRICIFEALCPQFLELEKLQGFKAYHGHFSSSLGTFYFGHF